MALWSHDIKVGETFSHERCTQLLTNNWKDYFIKRQNVFKIKSEVSRQQRHSLTFQCFLFLFFFEHIKMSYLFSPQVFNKHKKKKTVLLMHLFFFK